MVKLKKLPNERNIWGRVEGEGGTVNTGVPTTVPSSRATTIKLSSRPCRTRIQKRSTRNPVPLGDQGLLRVESQSN